MFYMVKCCWEVFDLVEQEKDGKKIKNAACKNCVDMILTYAGRTSGVARPGPTRACALPSTFQALPSRASKKSRDSIMN